MRHILILLPILLEGLLTDEVEKHNAAYQLTHSPKWLIWSLSCCCHGINCTPLNFLQRIRKILTTWPPSDGGIYLHRLHMSNSDPLFWCWIGGARFPQRCKGLFLTQATLEPALLKQKKCILSHMLLMTSFNMVTPKTLMLKDLKILHKEWLKMQGAKTNHD